MMQSPKPTRARPRGFWALAGVGQEMGSIFRGKMAVVAMGGDAIVGKDRASASEIMLACGVGIF